MFNDNKIKTLDSLDLFLNKAHWIIKNINPLLKLDLEF